VHLKGVEEMKDEPIVCIVCKSNHKCWDNKCRKIWQYLTEDEIKEIVGSYGDGIGGYTRELFDKIEAKIREKNEKSEYTNS
jgi:hypothetical protein